MWFCFCCYLVVSVKIIMGGCFIGGAFGALFCLLLFCCYFWVGFFFFFFFGGGHCVCVFV